eukprot:scaffold48139_cov59-Phaeocystis_antarctica.AAC.1
MELRLTFGAGSSQLPAPSTPTMGANRSVTPIRSLPAATTQKCNRQRVGKVGRHLQGTRPCNMRVVTDRAQRPSELTLQCTTTRGIASGWLHALCSFRYYTPVLLPAAGLGNIEVLR